MPVRVELSTRDVYIASKEARKRIQSFEENDTWDTATKTYGVEAEDRNFRGLMGELAFAKYADLTINAELYEKTDGGGDFRVKYKGDRCTIDIKTAKKDPYALFVKEGCVSADYYIQGHLDSQAVEFVGMATREEVLSTDLSETPYGHRNHEIPVEELDPIPEPEMLTRVG